MVPTEHDPRGRVTMRVGGTALLVVLALGALTAAVASAVRSTRGSAAQAPARVVVVPATPGASATAPAAPPALGLGPPGPAGPRLPATPGSVLSPARQPAEPAEPPVVTAPARTLPSRAVGRTNRGRLENGVLLPAEGANHTTWDLIENVTPNRDWRRVGTDRLVRTILTVAARYRRAHRDAPRVVVNDLSLPEGGRFGPEYGGLGHASHQNGLDVDVSYPRADGQEIGVERVTEIDRELSQALVDAFVKIGAQYVFVGPRTRLRGPKAIVQVIPNHDDHLHLRIPNVG